MNRLTINRVLIRTTYLEIAKNVYGFLVQNPFQTEIVPCQTFDWREIVNGNAEKVLRFLWEEAHLDVQYMLLNAKHQKLGIDVDGEVLSDEEVQRITQKPSEKQRTT